MDVAGMQELWASMPLAEAVVQVFQYVETMRRLQAIFDEHRGRCYDKVIRFPSLVAMIGDASWSMAGAATRASCMLVKQVSWRLPKRQRMENWVGCRFR